MKLSVDVFRSVSCVFDGNVSGRKVSWTIWNASHYLDKVSKPRLASARLRLCTGVTQTTRTDGVRSMGRVVQNTNHSLQLRSVLRAATFSCVAPLCLGGVVFTIIRGEEVRRFVLR